MINENCLNSNFNKAGTLFLNMNYKHLSNCEKIDNYPLDKMTSY